MSLKTVTALIEHLGEGRLDVTAQARLKELDLQCPDHARGNADMLYRALTLSVGEHDRLLAGVPIELSPRAYDCWSRSDIAIRHLLRTRSGQDPERPVCVILNRRMSSDLLAVDIEALSRHFLLDQPGVGGGSWNCYAAIEQEVIVRNPGGIVRINPQDLAQSWRPDNLADLWNPVPGEFFSDYDYEQRCIESFEGWDDNGCAMVGSGGRIYRVVPLASGWEPGAAPAVEYIATPEP